MLGMQVGWRQAFEHEDVRQLCRPRMGQVASKPPPSHLRGFHLPQLGGFASRCRLNPPLLPAPLCTHLWAHGGNVVGQDHMPAGGGSNTARIAEAYVSRMLVHPADACSGWRTGSKHARRPVGSRVV